MRIALVNPRWSFEHSIYFGCRAPHLPLELGAAEVLLEARGHETRIFDAQFENETCGEQAETVARFAPGMTVITTAPTYLFWRCTQPELLIPHVFLQSLGRRGGTTMAIGPHGSSTPGSTLRKLGVDCVIRGEPEEILCDIAGGHDWADIPSLAFEERGKLVETGGPAMTSFTDLPALHWDGSWIARHTHHHHRFGTSDSGAGAEVEASRGCPYSCSFCAKIDFRDHYRKRNLSILLEEIDALVAQGVTYLYFIDEIFLPDKALLEALRTRPLTFGIQTRIDLWRPDMIALLGEAGCVSIEAGVESLTMEGRAALDKLCRMSTEELTERLILARQHVPFVQANLIRTSGDDRNMIARWRQRLQDAGVWANDPVPLFPYPGSPDYRKLWGAPDDLAWERAHAHYLAQFDAFSDIQENTPRPLQQVEQGCSCA